MIMATKKGYNLSGKLGDEIHYIVNGKARVRKLPEHVNQPGTELQKAQWNSFGGISRLSSHMAAALKIGLFYPARRKKTYPHLLFRHINKACSTSDGVIDYPRVILSDGTVAQVTITSVKIRAIQKTNNRKITVTFDPCLQCGNANPDDEFYLYAYCPARRKGILFDPVPRVVGTSTIILTADCFDSQTTASSSNNALPIHLYAFLRCPGPTADTPSNARASARNRRGQTSTTIYIPLSKPSCQ